MITPTLLSLSNAVLWFERAYGHKPTLIRLHPIDYELAFLYKPDLVGLHTSEVFEGIEFVVTVTNHARSATVGSQHHVRTWSLPAFQSGPDLEGIVTQKTLWDHLSEDEAVSGKCSLMR
jgi:hypothetical protein